jgi:gas vesicle protein
MENKEIVKQMIDLYKISFENSFSAMVMFQDHAEKLLKNFIDHNPGMSDEGKKVIDQWNSVYKKGRDDFKKAMNEGYDKLETFFDNNSTFMFKDQSDNIFNTFSNQANWTPYDFKKAMEELASTYKNGYEELNKYVDKNVKNMGDFFSTTYKPQTKTKQQK